MLIDGTDTVEGPKYIQQPRVRRGRRHLDTVPLIVHHRSLQSNPIVLNSFADGLSATPLFITNYIQKSCDQNGTLVARLQSLVDGDEQRIMTADGATIQKELFNSPELASLIEGYSDEY